jgi:glycosyltransferase involved in cell wall biosynthesis
MSQPYKGQHILIDAVEACLNAGRAVHLALVGDGRLRKSLEAQVRRRRLTDRVRFLGQLSSGAAVREALDQSDLFVLPSLTEGLPRALIEAQARALPCLATGVGGIPELLSASECTPPGDPSQLASALLTLLDDPIRLSTLSQQNLQRARRFASRILRQRRQVFCSYLRDATAGPRLAAARRAA